MKIVQWILTVLSALYALLLLAAAFEGNIIPFIISMVAFVLIAPPLYPKINQRIPFLRRGFLKVFLCVVLWIIALMFLGADSISFGSVTVCAGAKDGGCPKSEIAVLDTTSELTVTAQIRAGLEDTVTVKQVSITMDYWPEPKQESQIYSQTFDAPTDKGPMSFTLKELDLKPGSYRLTAVPVIEGDKKPLSTDVQFAVWTSAEDVETRNSGELKNAGLFHNSVSEVKICEHSGERGTFCKEDMPEIATDAPAIGFTAEIPNLKIRRSRLRGDSQITFVMRILSLPGAEDGPPTEIFRETAELESDVGTYTLINPSPERGLPAGTFEVVTSLEAKDSLPIRKVFTIK